MPVQPWSAQERRDRLGILTTGGVHDPNIRTDGHGVGSVTPGKHSLSVWLLVLP